MKPDQLPFVINFARQPHLQKEFHDVVESPAAKRIKPFLQAIFTGQKVNSTELRAATHWTQRVAAHPGLYRKTKAIGVVDGVDEIAQAGKVRKRVETFVDSVRKGDIRNPDGQPYESIVHLGIGGSDLGPRLLDQVFERLGLRQAGQADQRPITLRFIANVDYHEQQWALRDLNPKTTLVVIASKSFTTRETMINARHVFEWLDEAGLQYRQPALVGVTCKPDKAKELGVLESQIFEFSENIGGRYSIWSPVSIAIRIVYGNPVFNDFLSGGAAMDAHVLRTDLLSNLPCLLAICDYINLQNGIDCLMLSPYDSRLGLLVPYLQQLWMESLGKGVTFKGDKLDHNPCPILWGDVGTNGQHAFFQLLHQAPNACAVELLAVKKPQHDKTTTHQVLMSHFLAQAEGFQNGKLNSSTESDTPGINHKTCPGGRPTTSIIMDDLNPAMLGSLLSLWEHRTAALAALNDINPFDQWGVELGKVIAQGLEEKLATPEARADDPVTDSLLQVLKTSK